ncbi:hypothetical protein [Absidia glauca]|uniref:Uncharacterized protein n=1 Tax=Absidia glauca TaxID=4829 RepID=A0A168KST6_ABSGL|nr:hypothetical protein [Absidia glauca]
MTLNPCTSFPAATEIHLKEQGHYLGGSMDVLHQSTPDSASSSNGASPTTPFDHRPFTFSDYQNREQFAAVLSNLPTPLLEDKPSSLGTDIVAALTIDSQKSHQHASDTESSHPSFVLTIMPDTPSNDNDADSNSTLNTNDNHLPPLSTKSSSSTLLRQQQQHSVTENDSISIGNSSYSVDCTDFPSPPSSTPSLVPRLKIQTNIQNNHQEPMDTAASETLPVNKKPVSSRFKEVFDLDGTDLEWDYIIKYRRPCNASPLNNPLPTKSTPSFVPLTATNDQHHSSKQQHRHMISGFITTIGRSTSSSSSPPTTTSALSKKAMAPEAPVRSLSTSSGAGSSSIRGLMRSFSTTATNHYRQQIPKMTLNNVTPPLIEEDGMTKAAQIVASTTDDDNTMHNTLANDNASLLTATSLDGRRRQKIAQLLSNAIKKAPTRRHTTKVVNMQPPPDTKKLVRRTVIYVNSAELANTESEIIRHYRPHRPAPSPPSTHQQQPYRYGKRLPPIPAKPSPTSSPRSSTTSSSSSSSSSSSFAATPTSSPAKQLPYLEGLELREMEDGTMEWGIIQKQGRRQSFFPMTHGDDEDDEGEIEQDVLALLGLAPDHLEKFSSSSNRSPPPIPRRSPRRKPSMALTTKPTPAATLVESRDDEDESTTDTYYAHEMNLPSLLRLMSETQQNARSTPIYGGAQISSDLASIAVAGQPALTPYRLDFSMIPARQTFTLRFFWLQELLLASIHFFGVFFASSSLFLLSIDIGTAPRTIRSLYNGLERRTQGNSRSPPLTHFAPPTSFSLLHSIGHYTRLVITRTVHIFAVSSYSFKNLIDSIKLLETISMPTVSIPKAKLERGNRDFAVVVPA